MRTAKRVSDAIYDEVSFVDVPAAADARIAIAKRHQEEAVPKATTEQPPEVVYDAQGNEIEDRSVLEEGDIVFDADGGTWEYFVPEADGEGETGAQAAAEDAQTERELAGVSKAFTAPLSKSLSETLRDEISKAASAEQREEIYKRALSEAAERAEHALEIAKRQEDLRLDAEYTEIAKGYNVPAKAETLGPILKRMAERLPEEDCEVIHKLLTSVGEVLTTELGFSGSDESADPYSKLEAMLDQQVSKSAGKVSKAAATEAYFDDDPREYEAYLATRSR